MGAYLGSTIIRKGKSVQKNLCSGASRKHLLSRVLEGLHEEFWDLAGRKRDLREQVGYNVITNSERQAACTWGVCDW
jgi:hypothetical protein